ncbi:hypothetical protein [Sphingobium tyrosinilyticum]|uniref:Uncharacterized protein n=1 Tax=Sphingobium tyrosinilyticum TaxID=2715436 RepID=A0ABV9EY29_9SPHN
MHATTTTATTKPTSWPDALASVTAAYATAASIGAGHAPGSAEEVSFNDAAAAIGDAVHALVAVPAPDIAAVSAKLKLLADEFGGADADHLTAISQDLARLAPADGELTVTDTIN